MKQLFLFIFLECLFVHHACAQKQAQDAFVRFVPGSNPSVAGDLTISSTDTGIQIKGQLTGLSPGFHGFHVHEHAALSNECRDAGGHFNPFMFDHGDPRDLRRHIGDLGNIEADERGTANVNIIDSQATLDLTSKAYIGNRSFVVHSGPDDLGRGGNPESLKTGNAGSRSGCGLLTKHEENPMPGGRTNENGGTDEQNILSEASVVFFPGSSPDIVGDVTITWTGDAILISGVVTGLSPGSHGFHIHENGELGNKCVDAGGHFNPFLKSHGGPRSAQRHVGDLGNIEADVTGTAIINIRDSLATLDETSQAYVGGLAMVIHAGADDLGLGGDQGSTKTGNAGGRLGCGIIEVQPKIHTFFTTIDPVDVVTVAPIDPKKEEIKEDFRSIKNVNVRIVPGSNPAIEGELTLSQQIDGVLIEGEVRGLSPGKHGFHIHTSSDLGNGCKNAGGHFNPFQTNHGGADDHVRHVGDLGNIDADASGRAVVRIFDQNPSLDADSQAYIGNRSIVIHAGEDDLGRGGNPDSLKTGNAGARSGCGVIAEPEKSATDAHVPKNQPIILPDEGAPSRFENSDFAIVRMVPGSNPAVNGELRIVPVEGGVTIRGEITGLTPGLHGFHVHSVGDLGNECKNAAGHFNPFETSHGDPLASIRHVGDLGNIEVNDIGRAVIDIFDPLASMDPSSTAYIGNRAIVVHAGEDDLGRGGDAGSLKTGNAGSRSGCGIIEVHNFEAAAASIDFHPRKKRSEFSYYIEEAFGDDQFFPAASKHVKRALAYIKVIPGTDKKVHGELEVTQVHDGIIFKGIITGLKPGLHGFHVHEEGNLGNKCQDAGPHFNPSNMNHGDLKDFHRHVGDLGNIKANSKGVAYVEIFDKIGSLDPHAKNFVGHRAVVVHADPDDLGRGQNEDSKRTGNSGARLGCGVIDLKAIPSHVGYHDGIQGGRLHSSNYHDRTQNKNYHVRPQGYHGYHQNIGSHHHKNHPHNSHGNHNNFGSNNHGSHHNHDTHFNPHQKHPQRGNQHHGTQLNHGFHSNPHRFHYSRNSHGHKHNPHNNRDSHAHGNTRNPYHGVPIYRPSSKPHLNVGHALANLF